MTDPNEGSQDTEHRDAVDDKSSMHSQQKIELTDEQKAKFIEYGDAYMEIHNAVTRALAEYVEAESLPETTEAELAGKKQAVSALYISLGAKLADLVNYFYQFEEE